MVVIGRLKDKKTWKCDDCPQTTGLNQEPFKSDLNKQRDIAQQIDLQEQERGNTIKRAGEP
jgi:hypothetical protein